MTAAKWQQASGAKKCENGRPITVRNRQLKKHENERKNAKTVENKRKQAKQCENDRDVFRRWFFLAVAIFSPILGIVYLMQLCDPDGVSSRPSGMQM